MQYAGQIAVVTGSAQGLGLAAARRLGEAGATLVVADRDTLRLDVAVASLLDAGIVAHAYTLDASVRDDVEAVFRTAAAKFGKIDILVNAAGVFPFTPFADLSVSEWQRVINVNLTGTFHTCQASFRYMREAGYGRIINFASGTFYRGSANAAAYVASKAGVIGLTRVIATEGGQHGITANAIAPGVIPTEGTQALENFGELQRNVLAVQAIKRPGEPADIAETVAYLASPAAGFITGQTISVGGGAIYN